MKYRILLVVLSLTMLNTNAQILKSIGIKGGISLSNQTFESKTFEFKNDFDYKSGLYTAVSAEFFGSKHFSLVADLGFVQKGMQFRMQETTVQMPEGTGEYITEKNTLNYLTFSPMLKGYLNVKKFTAYALLGPRIDQRLSVNSKYYNIIYDEAKKQVFGINYGLGVDYNINRISLSMEFMAQPDITPLLNKEPMTNFPGFKVMSNSYLINMGINYKFRRN